MQQYWFVKIQLLFKIWKQTGFDVEVKYPYSLWDFFVPNDS